MKILCCGSRFWDDEKAIANAIAKYGAIPEETIIIEGEAKGADTIAKYFANRLGYLVKGYPADWATFGKSAGPIRNQKMLDDNPDIDLVLAFHDDLINNSKGTNYMVARSIKKGIKVILYHHVIVAQELK